LCWEPFPTSTILILKERIKDKGGFSGAIQAKGEVMYVKEGE